MPDLDPRAFYAAQSAISDPGPYRALYHDLPFDLDALCGIVNGLIVHDLWIRVGALQISDERRQEAEIRAVPTKLERILEMDPRPLTESRPFDERLFGSSRDQALMLCSFLRYFGIPARVRTGFLTYFGPRNFEHWICQLWSADTQRWQSVDVQLDNMAREQRRLPVQAVKHLDFETRTPQDLPPEDFLTGGRAWLRCRSGQDDPLMYGAGGDLRGLWVVRNNLLRDLLDLNKVELTPRDFLPGSLMSDDRSPPAPAQLAFLDHVAVVTIAADDTLADVRRLYDETPALHMPEGWAVS